MAAQRAEHLLQVALGIPALLVHVLLPDTVGDWAARSCRRAAVLAARHSLVAGGLGFEVIVNVGDLGDLDQLQQEPRVRNPLRCLRIPAGDCRDAGSARQRGDHDGDRGMPWQPGRTVLAALNHPEGGIAESFRDTGGEGVLGQDSYAKLAQPVLPAGADPVVEVLLGVIAFGLLGDQDELGEDPGVCAAQPDRELGVVEGVCEVPAAVNLDQGQFGPFRVSAVGRQELRRGGSAGSDRRFESVALGAGFGVDAEGIGKPACRAHAAQLDAELRGCPLQDHRVARPRGMVDLISEGSGRGAAVAFQTQSLGEGADRGVPQGGGLP